MPDIRMCVNDYCTLKHNCKRHEASGAKPSDYQPIAYFIQADNGKCNNFMEKAK